jgi:hypothetical protein
MFTLRGGGARLCDGWTRRDMLHLGGVGALGLTLPGLLSTRNVNAAMDGGKAKACIVLFLMGGPPQHSTWDPKPNTPAEIRGEFKPIATNVPGIQVCELMPRLARHADKLCILRAISTNDNAHSSSGYYMMTGEPHQPMNAENANPGPPNDWPNLGGIVQRLTRGKNSMPASVRLPHRIFNTDGSVWPGQDAGFLGRSADPWLFNCEPGSPAYRVPQFSLAADMPLDRMEERRSLLHSVNQGFDTVARSGLLGHYDGRTQQAFDMLLSPRSRRAFDLEQEPAAVRDWYGQSQFGQSVLLARRLIEAGVRLVQVNWYRGPNEPSDNPCWDSHTKESERLKNVLVPPMDQAFAALLEDLAQRGMLDETLIVCMSEFGRSPKMNKAGGRDHWGHVFSAALAGGGIRGGQVYGASDKVGGQPQEGRVQPQDFTATVFACLGYRADTEIQDRQGRPIAISRGQAVRQVF